MKGQKALSLAAAAAVLLTTLGVAGPTRAADEPGPAYTVPAAKLARGLHCPRSFPRHGRKAVLLVHGTTLTDEENWGWTYAKQLPRVGFDVCTVLLPNFAFDDVQVTSEYVVFAIRRMAELVGAKISVVGISQGALQPRWAIKWWPDIRNLVDDYVSMAGTNHGSYFGNASCSSDCLPALWQQSIRTEGYRATSRFLNALNWGDETPGRVSYTSVYSVTDPVIQPIAPKPVAAIEGASNVAVQDICPGRFVEHLQSVWDAVYYAVVLDALTHRGAADPGRIDAGVCAQVTMPGVDPLDAAARSATLYAVISQRQAAGRKVAEEPPLKPYVLIGAPSGRTFWSAMTTRSGTRRYMLYEPAGPARRRPLVVYLHGCSERADSTAIASRYSELASKLGFYLVYPEQPQEANGNRCWNWFLPDHQHRGSGEPEIIAAITRAVMTRRPVDPRRVYVTGISAGGAMAVIMGATYPDLYAAVGAEAGAQYRGLPCVTVPCVVPPEQSGRWAYEEMGKQARQVPVFALVGDEDVVSPRENTERVIQEWLTTADWADDGSDDGSVAREPRSTRTGRAGGYGFSVDTYVNGAGCLLAERWLVAGLAHAHSAGYPDQNYSDPYGPSPAVASYRFFLAHPMQPGRTLRCA